jgi:serine/threonine protein kinase
VILFEMLTGKLPFDSKGQFEIMLAHVNMPPKHPSDVNPEVPRDVSELVLRALAKEPERRFQTAKEFRLALEGALGMTPNGVAAAATAGGEDPPAYQASPRSTFRPTYTVSTEPPSRGFGSAVAEMLVSKVGLTVAAGALTFLLGSAALIALLALTK